MAGDVKLAPVKRETGANPVRTRHCDKGVSDNKPLNYDLGRQSGMMIF